ncbi:hypothetical protein DO021_17645 [Desulfobacter hydrogenophilus]|uniref:Uncharacterized protein n=1 Tax=Desulfobacter hydrogenophilus TaxID=2291 RepID=A0A328F7V5_9BACT|nr:hypothetical protein [Desulfobacter hydrogenophilus]NDY73504.1 hypothetical protein [Desulfobacter hydrogenophilus]QBH15727.1 hypothetical protein EYB58_22920 [Desulfobacter hydrogenophilus]RAM00698.1 hypothetical protein DO021_17645 [Desulfobacter hydrogenophilus]
MKKRDRVLTEYGPGEIISISGYEYTVRLDIKPIWLKSDINTFRKSEILSIDKYEKTLPQKKIIETQLSLFETLSDDLK